MDKSLELHTADLMWLILILVRVELSRTDIQLYVASHPDAPVKITPLKVTWITMEEKRLPYPKCLRLGGMH